jgi:hypothetical protein
MPAKKEETPHRLNNGHDLCLFPDCTKAPTTRGLCGVHYIYATRAVKRDGYTWEQLEKAGKALPTTRKVERKNTSWFTEGVKKDVDVQES